MKLFYYQGNNFGDELNPLIFNKLLPDFFDNNEQEVFLGIGSILGFEQYKKAQKKIIFSSGIAKGNQKEYGTLPVIDNSYEFLCVRGPLTAETLGLDPKLAVTDGAVLISTISQPPQPKKYPYTFIPHKNTTYKFDWKPICDQAGVHLISPQDGVENVLFGILQSEVIFAESLHAAIVADAFRIPWIPVKSFYSISTFKWKDWTSSMELPYHPVPLIHLFSEDMLNQLLVNKIKMPILTNLLAKTYSKFQNRFILDKNIEKLNNIKKLDPYLSKDRIINEKVDILMDLIVKLQSNKKSF